MIYKGYKKTRFVFATARGVKYLLKLIGSLFYRRFHPPGNGSLKEDTIFELSLTA